MASRTTTRTGLAFVALLILGAVAPAAGQSVGTVAARRGLVEVQRGGEGAWQQVEPGSSVQVSDHIRTQPDAAAKILFGDDSILDLGGDSHLVVDRYAVNRGAAEPRSLLKLLAGKVRVLVGNFFPHGRLRYEIETPTAVVRIPPSEVVVSYDPQEKNTQVIALDRTVQVQGVLGVIGPGVDLPPGQVTNVQQGRFPSAAEPISAERIASSTAGLEIVGTGTRDGLAASHPALEGKLLAPQDRPEAVAPPQRAAVASYLHPSTPGETLAERLSPDVRANTQPIPDYKAVPPTGPGDGTVVVDF